MQRLALLVATVGYTGHLPVAPGTAGAAVGVGVLAGLRWLKLPAGGELAVVAFAAIAGVWSSGVAERHLRRLDPRPVVVDELAGMLVTLALVPLTGPTALAGFLLFRLADIVKPYPAARFERLTGGWGIMADDLVAGLYAHLALRVLIAVAPEWMV